jgi:hypothetical protein
VDVSGIGTATFTGNIQVAENQNLGFAGIGDFTQNLTILGTTNAALVAYALQSSIGPLSGTAGFNITGIFTTDVGNSTLTSVAGNSTFAATTGVPEPASIVLIGIALLGLIGFRLHRKSHTASNLASLTR